MSAAAVILSFLPGIAAAWLGSRMGLTALAFMPGDGQTGTEHEVSEPVHLDHGDWGWAAAIVSAALWPVGNPAEIGLAAAVICAVIHTFLLFTVAGFILKKR